jgi:hypothetical protein
VCHRLGIPVKRYSILPHGFAIQFKLAGIVYQLARDSVSQGWVQHGIVP